LTQKGGNEITELRQAVIDQKKANLPPEAAEPALTRLHQAVVAYDQLVSQLVIAVIQGWESPVTAAEIHAAQVEAAREAQSPQVQGSRRLSFYQTYLARLDRMVALSEAIHQRGPSA
jgi:hypothetical protein